MNVINYQDFPRAGFRRRLASWIYDVLVAIAVYMAAGAVGFLIFATCAYFGIVDMNGHQHLIDAQKSSIIYSVLIYGWNIAWLSFFFVFFLVEKRTNSGDESVAIAPAKSRR
jgi:hypothetical protein